MEENFTSSNSKIELDEIGKSFLKETAKWAYLLSILGFIGIGLMVIAGFTMGRFGNGFLGQLSNSIIFVYLIIAALYFFPIYYLNRFAVKTKIALNSNCSETLTSSLEYLKSHYKFIGILVICGLVFYAFAIVGMILTFTFK